MGYDIGWAALNMEMPKRIPRTEYSAESHWELVSAVTGKAVSVESSDNEKREGRLAFTKAWDYSFRWSVLVHRGLLSGRKTSMGHAEYAAGGVDYNDDVACPFTDPEDVLNFDPEQEYGPVNAAALKSEYEAHYRRNCREYDDAINMTGVYITMFSGLIEIFGWDMLLLAAGLDAAGFGEMARRYEKWITPAFQAFADSDVPVMMSHDDIVWTSGPVVHPEWYRTYIFPAYKRLWQPVVDAGKRLVYTSDGNYTMFFDDVVEAGAHTFVMEPTSNMALFAEKYGQTHGFIGNADTRILLSGTKDQIRQEVERCMSIGRNCPGFFMAVGNHIPSNTPVENALYYNEVYEELAER